MPPVSDPAEHPRTSGTSLDESRATSAPTGSAVVHRATRTAIAFDEVIARLERWPRGALALNGPMDRASAQRLARAAGPRSLPADYVALLCRFDGLDLRDDRIFSAAEALDALSEFEAAQAHAFDSDPDWEHARPPSELFPIATDLEGNLKCLDLSTTPPEVVDWHHESGVITTWYPSVTAFVAVALDVLELRFDPKGRPRRLKAGESVAIERRELAIHLEYAPNSSYALLELARADARDAPPELALASFRRAAKGVPERAIAHIEYGLFALRVGRITEARAALRRGLMVSPEPNPRKHDIRFGPLSAIHALLARLYDAIGQRRKASEHRRHSDAAAKRYDSQWEADSDSYQLALARVFSVPQPRCAPGQDELWRSRQNREDEPRTERDPAIAFDITEPDDDYDEAYEDL